MPGHAADASVDSTLVYEGTYFRNVASPIVGDAGGAFVPVGATVSSTNAPSGTVLTAYPATEVPSVVPTCRPGPPLRI